jgi:hypothetical protein
VHFSDDPHKAVLLHERGGRQPVVRSEERVEVVRPTFLRRLKVGGLIHNESVVTFSTCLVTVQTAGIV